MSRVKKPITILSSTMPAMSDLDKLGILLGVPVERIAEETMRRMSEKKRREAEAQKEAPLSQCANY